MATATPTRGPQTDSSADPKIEDWLKSHGAPFELKEIALADINERRSLHNQARFQPLDEHLVVTYAEAMEAGAIFPPIVVTDVGTGYLIIDGNHRFAAARLAGKTHLPAYVSNGLTERQILVLTFDANTKHGLPTTPEERKQHAVYLVETAGITQKDASRMLNVPTRELNLEITRVRSEKRFTRLGIDRWSDLAKSSRMRLHNISDDVVCKAAVELAIQAKMGLDAVNIFVSEVNTLTSQSDQLAYIEAERKRLAGELKASIGGRVRMPTDVIRLNRAVAYAERMVLDRVDPAVMDGPTKATLRERISGAIAALEAARERLA